MYGIARWPANSWHGGLQFGSAIREHNIYLPQRLCKDCVIYTGTHDNDTTLGWWNSNLNDYERRAVLAAAGDLQRRNELGFDPAGPELGGQFICRSLAGCPGFREAKLV